MRYTLLKSVQLILSAMDSDEVNSISDTTESLQVVDILETTFNDLASTLDFTEQWDFFQLEADSEAPTIMTVPSYIAKLEYVEYNTSDDDKTKYKEIVPMARTSFLHRLDELDPGDANIVGQTYVAKSDSFPVNVWSDRAPTYFMTANDSTLIFDAYDSSQSATLEGSRTRCYGMFVPDFTRQDDWIAPFEARQFTLYFNEAKSQCFADLKQVSNAKAEQRARKGWVQAQRKRPRVDGGDVQETWTPNFGRARNRR